MLVNNVLHVRLISGHRTKTFYKNILYYDFCFIYYCLAGISLLPYLTNTSSYLIPVASYTNKD